MPNYNSEEQQAERNRARINAGIRSTTLEINNIKTQISGEEEIIRQYTNLIDKLINIQDYVSRGGKDLKTGTEEFKYGYKSAYSVNITGLLEASSAQANECDSSLSYCLDEANRKLKEHQEKLETLNTNLNAKKSELQSLNTQLYALNSTRY